MTKSANQRHENLLAFIFLLVLGAITYSSSLDAPWYFDDFQNIANNLQIRNLGQTAKQVFNPRGLGTLTFALNYHFSGLDVRSYHLVNIGIHIITSFLVFLILKRVTGNRLFYFAGALIFLVHPAQTQSITYIVQRFASLAGLLFFLALYLFIKAREDLSQNKQFFSPKHLMFYTGALISGALAVHTKQNTAILPIALFLFDRYFLNKEQNKHILRSALYLLPFFAAPLYQAFQQFLSPILQGMSTRELTSTYNVVVTPQNTEIIKNASGLQNNAPKPGLIKLARETAADVSPWDYLITEFTVIWIYIKLLFLPVNQALDYTYPIQKSFFNIKTIASTAGIALLFITSLITRRKMPLISFGILWFFLALAVESTFIPLDPIFEHRLYIPILGFITILIHLTGMIRSQQAQTSLLLIMLIVLSLMTYQRNALWANPVAFYEDHLKQGLKSERILLALSERYIDAKQLEKAEDIIREVIKGNPYNEEAYENLSKVYIDQNRLEDAAQVLKTGLNMKISSRTLLNNYGVVLLKLRHYEEAIDYFNRIIKIDPKYAKAYTNIGRAYNALHNNGAAVEILEKGLRRIPDDYEILETLGAIYSQSKMPKKAIALLKKVISINPGAYSAHNNLGVVYEGQGNLELAIESYRQALDINPDYPQAFFNLGVALYKQGNKIEALKMFAAAARLQPDYAEAIFNFGSLAIELGDYRNGVVAIEQLEKIDPRYHKELFQEYRAALQEHQ